jgi:Tfp pilus assembly protein PilX
MMALLVGLSLFLVIPVFLITAALLNLWSVRATTALIEYQRARQEAEEAAAANAPPAEERGRKGQVRPK